MHGLAMMPVPDKGADGRLVYRVPSLTWKKIFCFTESGKELPELDRLRPCQRILELYLSWSAIVLEGKTVARCLFQQRSRLSC